MFLVLFGLVAVVQAESFYLSLLKKRMEEGYHIKYRFTVWDADGKKESHYVVIYRQGDKFRYDTLYDEMESRLYNLSGKTYSCSQTPDGWFCMENAMATLPADFFGKSNIPENLPSTGTRIIAGQKTKCYQVTMKSGEKVECCVSKDGLPLYLRQASSGEGQFEMVAVEFSHKVSAKDFRLPARPMRQTFPGFGGFNIPAMPGN